MSTLMVYESMWGNTREVAEAVADRLGDDVTVVEVADAPARLPAGLDLLVVGGPTHAFSMSRAGTRRSAVEKGAEVGHVERGIREWLEEVEAGEPVDVATFDTRVGGTMQHLPGSAAKSAGRQVRHHHLGRLIATESFYVDDTEGPLSPGEVDRARAWGESLAVRD
ncbi:flavodoxin family protein [Nocardioides sp. P5_C9_2]